MDDIIVLPIILISFGVLFDYFISSIREISLKTIILFSLIVAACLIENTLVNDYLSDPTGFADFYVFMAIPVLTIPIYTFIIFFISDFSNVQNIFFRICLKLSIFILLLFGGYFIDRLFLEIKREIHTQENMAIECSKDPVITVKGTCTVDKVERYKDGQKILFYMNGYNENINNYSQRFINSKDPYLFDPVEEGFQEGDVDSLIEIFQTQIDSEQDILGECSAKKVMTCMYQDPSTRNKISEIKYQDTFLTMGNLYIYDDMNNKIDYLDKVNDELLLAKKSQ